MIKEMEFNIDVEKIKTELNVIPDITRQLCLQGVEGSNDPFLGVGQSGSKNSWERKQIHSHKTTEFKFPLFDMPYTNDLIENFKMTHTRLMYLKPKRCYSYHRDNLKRIHLVVTTNEDCWIIIEKQVFHLPINGSYFIVDTTKMHTAVNASDEGRIHIIGNIE
jgi:hypothetical protein